MTNVNRMLARSSSSDKLQALFSQFLQEKRFIQNVSQNTVAFYHQSLKAFKLSLPLTQAHLNASIVQMRESGKSVGCVNAYIRGINPLLSWMFANGHLVENLKLKKLRYEEPPMKTFSDAQIRAILSHKPASNTEKRLLAILTLLIDSGLRINECLTLRRASIDFENLLIDVKGKGSKFRRIPISVEARKVLFRHLRTHEYELVFCTRNGTKLLYDNMRRDFSRLAAKLGITGVDGSFHAFRRYFVTYSIRKNVNPFLIQRMLGHSSLHMTNRYAKLETSDLSLAHKSALQI